jgi:membrane protease YdiL (CAAX protease family)
VCLCNKTYLNIILQIVIYGIAIIGVVILMWKPFEEDLKRINKKTFAFGAMGFGLLYAANIVGTIFLTLIGVMNFKSNASNQDAINSMFNTSIPNLIILFIVIVIMAPILEELVFRKAIFKQFKNKYLALIVSSLAFGMLHVISSALLVFINITNGEATFFDFVLELIYVIPYSLMGFALGIAYIKSNKNIASSMFAHFLNNLISYIGSLIISLNPELLEKLEDAAVILINFLH